MASVFGASMDTTLTRNLGCATGCVRGEPMWIAFAGWVSTDDALVESAFLLFNSRVVPSVRLGILLLGEPAPRLVGFYIRPRSGEQSLISVFAGGRYDFVVGFLVVPTP